MERFRGYRFHSAAPWSEEAKAAVLGCLGRFSAVESGALGGRAPIVRAEIAGQGRVVVKRYGRGGILRKLISDRYLLWGPTRSQSEFDILALVRALGVSAPEPLACLSRGAPFYRAWLVTREISDHHNLAELSRIDEDAARGVLDGVVHQISLLIEHRILHVDLHPGNVVIDGDAHVYILDFDRARRFEGERNVLRDRYLHRWRRAVIKHGLPDFLAEYVCLGLRRNFAPENSGNEAR